MLINYMISEYKRRAYYFAKQTVLFSVVVGCIFAFSALWPAMDFYHTALYQHSKFDIAINGPITGKEFNEIKKLAGSSSRLVATNSPQAQQIVVNGRAYRKEINVILFEKKDHKDIGLTYLSDGLIVAGNIEKDGIALDALSASYLGAGIGDDVTLVFEFVNQDNLEKVNMSLSGKLTALFAPTSNIAQSAAAPISDEIKNYFSREEVIYSDLFIKTDSRQLPALLSKVNAHGQLNISPISRLRVMARSAADMSLNRNIQHGMIWVALSIYLIYSLREQFLRIESRKKNIAIFISLGMPARKLFAMFSVEQLVVNSIIAVAGMYIGKYILQDMWAMYIPRETYVFNAIFILLINIFVLLLTFMQLSYRIRKLDVAKLLTSE